MLWGLGVIYILSNQSGETLKSELHSRKALEWGLNYARQNAVLDSTQQGLENSL